MATVLLVSHTGRGTGFGRVAAGIAAALVPAFATHVVGLGPSQAGETWLGHDHDPCDGTRTFRLRELAAALRPAAVLLVGVGKLSAWQAEVLRDEGFAGSLVAYVPVEGDIWQPAPLAGLRHCTTLVAYTQVAAQALRRALPAAGPPVVVIPHAIDPLVAASGCRVALRRALFPAFAHRAEGSWLLNANRNDERKQPELTLQAFAEVAAAEPAATLVLHGQPHRPGVDLRQRCEQLGLRDRVIFSRAAGPWPELALAHLYRCCDIGVNSALGEGWGLIAFEHALHGGAQLLPAHAGLRELWGDAPHWVPLGEPQALDDVFAGRPPTATDLVQAMRHLIGQPQQSALIAQACGQRARQVSFGWPAVGAA